MLFMLAGFKPMFYGREVLEFRAWEDRGLFGVEAFLLEGLEGGIFEGLELSVLLFW
jgi:hypothetical protein